MSEFKDRQVDIARMYLFVSPLVLLIGYIFSLLLGLTNGDFKIETDISNPIISNIVGSLGLGYSLFCECTIIFVFIQLFRKSKKPMKILLLILLIPAMLICVFPAMVFTIPYYIYTYVKTQKIAIDNKSIFSKYKIVTLVCAIVVALIVTLSLFL